MKHYLFYGCNDKYERGPMELLKSILVRDDEGALSQEANAREHELHFKKYFERNEYSALYILVLDLDPAKGSTAVIRNEYAENPLKTRIVINAAARGMAPAPKKKTIGQIMAEQAMVAPQFAMFDEVSEPDGHEPDHND